MKKTHLTKIFLMVVIAMMIISFATSVFAADENGFTDLTNTLTNSAGNNTSTNTNISGNTNISNSVSNTNTNTNANTNRNSSVYNNTVLPKTGIEDSVPVALLIVVFVISAIFAYKKVNEYKNI